MSFASFLSRAGLTKPKPGDTSRRGKPSREALDQIYKRAEEIRALHLGARK